MDKVQEHLGHWFRDMVTGYTGVCTGVCVYLGSSPTMRLEPGAFDDTSGDAKHRWVDLQRTERMSRDPIVVEP